MGRRVVTKKQKVRILSKLEGMSGIVVASAMAAEQVLKEPS
jgi:hypothetical protein